MSEGAQTTAYLSPLQHDRSPPGPSVNVLPAASVHVTSSVTDVTATIPPPPPRGTPQGDPYVFFRQTHSAAMRHLQRRGSSRDGSVPSRSVPEGRGEKGRADPHLPMPAAAAPRRTDSAFPMAGRGAERVGVGVGVGVSGRTAPRSRRAADSKLPPAPPRAATANRRPRAGRGGAVASPAPLPEEGRCLLSGVPLSSPPATERCLHPWQHAE